MQPALNAAPRHASPTVLPLPSARPPAAPAQGLAARQVTILQMPQTLCRAVYGTCLTGVMAAGSAAAFLFGAQSGQDPEGEYTANQLGTMGVTLGFGAFVTAGATVQAVRSAFTEERAALIQDAEVHESPTEVDGQPVWAEHDLEAAHPNAIESASSRPPSPEGGEIEL
ncbi:MAG: hypothetical protein RIS88_2594 [Pseudomonadota bacterium]|jgi:hypothetical protein